ncbi:protein K [Rosenbergiella nectarea]|uniref:protein K n=1 Tax=Rosenbergiella nectarea TaxID=988801 RepID=UPI001BDA489E|nr:protein K [Rosenbergiella nectarea]MBT0728845.1 protein K [Rosenbergiella nectarea subsp. apis]
MALHRLVIFTLSLCLLAACDDSSKAQQREVAAKEATQNTSSEKVENFQKQNVNDKSTIQAMIIDGAKKKLPLLIDQATLLTEVSTKSNTFIYHYEVKGIPVSVIDTNYWQKNMKKTIQVQYCKDDDKMKVFREFFPEGSTYNYFVDNKLVYSHTITPAECH